MASSYAPRTLYWLAITSAFSAGLLVAVAVFAGVHTSLPFPALPAMALLAAVMLGAIVLLAKLGGGPSGGLSIETLALGALTCAGVVAAAFTAYQMLAYISLPADILSFSEGNVVNGIMRLRLGLPLYTAPEDNNSSMYTPGTEILIYLVSSLFGGADSVPFFRLVQYGALVAAALLATSICDLLARQLLNDAEYAHRPLWIALWLPFIFLATTDPHFNPYSHSLHNDGFALLVAMAAYWLILRHSLSPRGWHLAAMAVLPAIGFMFKQNQLLWAGIFGLYLLGAGRIGWRRLVLFGAGCALAVAVTVGVGLWLWGEHYFWWVFVSLGQKQVSLPRVIMHLMDVGVYAIMGLIAGWVFVLQNRSRTALVLWLCWLLTFGIQVYTSGFAWMTNHLGPSVVLATCWFLVALAKLWPGVAQAGSWWQARVQETFAVAAVVLLFGAVGLVREPINPVPADFHRYVAEIEREFEGAPPDRVLMDIGSWIYLRHGVEMRDREQQVALHQGKNQEIDHVRLRETIARIESRRYDKILAHELDTGRTGYDFQDRGSGVKAAIFANYEVVRRIRAVEGVRQWWPMHLISEILVLVPNQNDDRVFTSPMPASSRPIPPH